jgi:copper chaperone CopZ
MMDVRPALVLFTALLIACGTPAAALPAPRVLDSAPVSADVEAGQDELSLEVIELMCSPCAAQIVSKSRLVTGVTHVSMVLATKTLTVRFDPERITRQALVATVEQIVATIQ